MRGAKIPVGFIPLVDAAPLIVAQEMGFAAEEGLELDLKRAPSWSSLRDMLAFGQVDAAHMLAPAPVAGALGIGNTGGPMSAISVLSVNGNVVGVSTALAERMRAEGHDFAFNDARATGAVLIAAAPERLRIAVPFPFSMHAELLYYWLNALGFPAHQTLDIHTVPPALMAEALRAGEVDAFSRSVGARRASVRGRDGKSGDANLPSVEAAFGVPDRALHNIEQWNLGCALVRQWWKRCPLTIGR